jgi:DnaJ-class molecular chaperone
MFDSLTLTYRCVAPELLDDGKPDDRPLNRLPKLMMSATEESAIAEIAKMEAQGYKVEEAILEASCTDCKSYGRIAHKPKGWRKKTAPPPFMMRYTECATCKGTGYVDSKKLVP